MGGLESEIVLRHHGAIHIAQVRERRGEGRSVSVILQPAAVQGGGGGERYERGGSGRHLLHEQRTDTEGRVE